MRKLDKHTATATARVEYRRRTQKRDTATFLRRARAASLKAKGSRFGALAEEEYDKIAPVIACTLPALTDPIPERKKRDLGEVTSELQVVGEGSLDCHTDMDAKQRQDQGNQLPRCVVVFRARSL